ncbi:TetR/AcrR family transcriptional regulator [Kineothrix sedimenti]|uniref:TetR/AcrR family transcriptional regulator n=1 Tax=Kineothrix sedimenti TaxID=3123317 RepID=A0ABZ3F029_9FIRM
MEEQSTKRKIMSEALKLFARKGYEAVSVAQIAEAVGIKAPSLYKHYKSKHDIFDAILEEMSSRYEMQAASMQMNGVKPDRDMELYIGIDEERLIEMGKGLFSYFLHDEYAGLFRRMLTVEQFHNKELGALFVKQYVDEPLSYQGMLFSLLIQAGVFIPENSNVMALHFYAPMYLLLVLCDCHPERESEVMEMLVQHIRQFRRLYGKKEDKR